MISTDVEFYVRMKVLTPDLNTLDKYIRNREDRLNRAAQANYFLPSKGLDEVTVIKSEVVRVTPPRT